MCSNNLNEDNLQWKTTSNGRRPQNINSCISQQLLMDLPQIATTQPTKQNKTKQNKTKTKQNKTKQNKTGIRNWNSELKFGIGIWNWNLELEFRIWN